MKSTYFLLLYSFGCFEVDFCGLSEIKSLSVIHLYPKSWGDFPFFSLPLHASSSHKHELHPCNQVDNFLVLQCPQQHSPCQAIVCGSRVRCGGRVHSGKRLQQARLLQSLPCSRQGGVIWIDYTSKHKKGNNYFHPWMARQGWATWFTLRRPDGFFPGDATSTFTTTVLTQVVQVCWSTI